MQKSLSATKKSRTDSKSRQNRQRQTIILFGLCKPAIFIIVVAHIVLAAKSLVKILWPSLGEVAEVLELLAHSSLAGLWLYKVLQMWQSKSNRQPLALSNKVELATGNAAFVVAIEDGKRTGPANPV